MEVKKYKLIKSLSAGLLKRHLVEREPSDARVAFADGLDELVELVVLAALGADEEDPPALHVHHERVRGLAARLDVEQSGLVEEDQARLAVALLR